MHVARIKNANVLIALFSISACSHPKQQPVAELGQPLQQPNPSVDREHAFTEIRQSGASDPIESKQIKDVLSQLQSIIIPEGLQIADAPECHRNGCAVRVTIANQRPSEPLPALMSIVKQRWVGEVLITGPERDSSTGKYSSYLFIYARVHSGR